TRVEVYTLSGAEEVLRELSERGGIPPGRLRECFRFFTGREAAEHLLRMACLLESRAMGESYLLWQVEAAAAHARGALAELFSRAVAAGREAERTLSSDLHREVYRELGDAAQAERVTLYGVGRTGRELAALLASQGAEVTVAHRCADIAKRCAAEVGGTASTSVMEACRQAELLICATLASHVRLKPEMVRHGCVVVDLSLPTSRRRLPSWLRW
ncbi:MAG: NAD(P)-binding domain-containing protein, partial [Euryarchaeota archaeon]|nr:NAD(P)-binding domain-containing protein [Euryarchaeota archaeon]